MEKEIEQLKIENKEKDDALIELSQFYDVSKNKNLFNFYFIAFYSILKTIIIVKAKVNLLMKKITMMI